MTILRGLSVALLSAALAAPAAAAEPIYKTLPSGRYSVKIVGLITTTCGRGIEKELVKLPEVEAAKVDFETETLVLTVKLNRTLKLSAIRRALSRAAHRVNLLSEYEMGAISYLP